MLVGVVNIGALFGWFGKNKLFCFGCFWVVLLLFLVVFVNIGF